MAAVMLPCFAQTPPKYVAKVQLSVLCEDGSLKSQFTSFLSRELRSLGDVTMVEEKPDFVISVGVLKVQKVGEITTGFAASSLVTKPLAADIVTGPVLVLGHNLDVGATGDIQSKCQGMIADFDTSVLGPDRRLWTFSHKPPADKN